MESLSDIRSILADRRARRTIKEVPTKAIGLEENGRLSVDGKTFALGAEAQSVLARRANIPAEFFAHSRPKIQKFLFDELYPDAVTDAIRARKLHYRTGLIILDGDGCVGMVDPRLTFLYGDDVLNATLATKPDDIDETQLEVPHFQLNGEVRISIVSRSLTTEARIGDIVYAGIDIRHSDSGVFATQIESYLYRKICSNGMMMKVCRHTDAVPLRLRRAAVHNPDRMLRRIQAMAKSAWGELGAKMEAVRLLADERVDNRAALIRSVGEKLRFPQQLVDDILQALDEDESGPTGTLWDIVGAISRVGTHSNRLSMATRRFLQELSGDLVAERVERCPTCGRLNIRHMRFLPRR
jgi:hypothetical protein